MNKTTEALLARIEKLEAAAKLAEEALHLYRPMSLPIKITTKDKQREEALAAIRETLAEPEITTPDVCGEVCARAKLCYGCGKALDEANAKLAEPYACEAGECPDKSLCAGACECLYKAEPVKQEPVARHDGFGNLHAYTNIPPGTLLYAAPVSAKREWVELTYDEICIASEIDGSDEWFYTAIHKTIAAFKEKNK